MTLGADVRPDPVPWDPARPLFESALIGIGTMRMAKGHPELNRDRVAYVWPTISLPRLPYAVSFDREERVQGDRNTAVFHSVGSVMRRSTLTDEGLSNVWIDVHPAQLAAMLSARQGGSRDPDARFPWRFAPLPTAPLLGVTRLAARLAKKQGGGGSAGIDAARAEHASRNPPAAGGAGEGHSSEATETVSALEIEETVLGAIASIVSTAADAWAPSRRRPPSAAQARFHREVVDEVRRRLAVSPAERHSLEGLAGEVHVSPFHLCRLFKRHTGLPIHRYLERLRLRAALDDALNSRARMLEIALRHGFCSEAHLSNAFVREFGDRPSVLRRWGQRDR